MLVIALRRVLIVLDKTNAINKLKNVFYLILIVVNGSAQDSTISKGDKRDAFNFSAYIEPYYSYDLNKPASNTRPAFIYSHNRHNEFNLNLGYIKASFVSERARANLAFATGTYMNANYATEPGVLKNIFEANAGYKLSKQKNFWLDIGILPSHIGFESAIGKDCWTLTRSMVADNSPYFESGAKLSYGNENGKLVISALALNGWQRISRAENNSMISWGSQFVVKLRENVTFNYSTFFGTDKPDSARLFRTYHNVYGIFQLSEKIGFTGGFDIGTEEKSVSNNEKNSWYSPVGIIRYSFGNQWAIAVRGEYFQDTNGVIIATGTPEGFKTTGFSLNLDYLPVQQMAIRLEMKRLHSRDPIFLKSDQSVTNNNTAITFALAVAF